MDVEHIQVRQRQVHAHNNFKAQLTLLYAAARVSS